MPLMEDRNLKRIAWIDVAKGLLIALVVFHHFPKCTHYINPVWQFLWDVEWLYTPYFMATFFIITGYCSNFKLEFKAFILKNFKTLLVANFFMFILVKLIAVPLDGPKVLLHLTSIDIWLFHSFWFFKALFWAKVSFWAINRFVSSRILQCVFVLLLSYAGVLLHLYDVFPDYLAHRNGLIFLFFIFVGNAIKKLVLSNKKLVCGCVLYCLLMLTLYALNSPVPFVDAENNMTFLNYPLWLLLALSGSCIVFLISKYMQNVTLLANLGMSTIVTYPLSSRIMGSFLRILHNFFSFENSIFVGVVLYIFVPILTLIICKFCYSLINTKHLKFLIGKF